MKKLHEKLASTLFEIASIVLSSVVAIVIIFAFFFRLVGVDGSSMVPTLKHQDWLITSTATREYVYKDIVIVVQPGMLNEPLVKRVIDILGAQIKVESEVGKGSTFSVTLVDVVEEKL